MSTKSKQLAPARAARPRRSGTPAVQVPQGHHGRANTGVSTGAYRRQQRPRYQARRGLARWDLILLLAGAVVVALVIGSSFAGWATTPNGKVTAAQTSYDFGDVPIKGGLITTKFPLTVEGDARAVDIVST